ncbi:DUF947-domain-containing protein [Hypoxylon fragiforme]|uniref:DUF947-domain-containing protein n=1 Tax=Hypoxylon fragiforme TaxID=63214 RepID=UPI0020C61BBC|nr:DUF947-domain-containing protein [Hypoxylon fragiforme]KAI2609020.1 DUF947-domain-containing protein [Hypoxylon fragiforme]
MNRIKAAKRKAPPSTLQRRVRARKDEPEDIPSDQFPEESNDEGEEDDDDEDEDESEDDDDESNASSSSSSSSSDEDTPDPSKVVSQISFGALAKAQASLPNLRRGKGGRKGQEEDESEDENADDKNPASDNFKAKSAKLPKLSRSSKHAPAEQTSKRQVSRRREVILTHKPAARDPRFSAAVSSRPVDEEKMRKAYGFLDTYRESEMARLKEAIKKTRRSDPAAQEELKRALASMQGKKKSQEQHDRERELVESHRRQEKELVKQGKKPFYLKKSEQKKQLLLDRFADLKGKQVDRVIERRRKKLTARDRKDMPIARRGAE